jgi:hypothetical protein
MNVKAYDKCKIAKYAFLKYVYCFGVPIPAFVIRRYGDGLFLEVPPLASDALLTTLHPLLENVNGVIRQVHELFKRPSWFSAILKMFL